jgi:peroxiredoxin
MTGVEARGPLQPGERAPDFTLPNVNRDGLVSLSDYRGKNHLLLAIMRGLYCAFCRRHIEYLSASQPKLKAAGVETLVIVATKPERARLYFRYRPTKAPLAADPDLVTHRAYGVPNLPITPDLLQTMQTVQVNPTGELPQPVAVGEAGDALNRLDGFEPTDVDRDDKKKQGIQLVGQFLVDRGGIVRWANIEASGEGPAGVGKFPTEDELLAAGETLPPESGRPAWLKWLRR